MTSDILMDAIEFKDGVSEDLRGGKQRLTHSQVLRALSGEEECDGGRRLRDEYRVGNGDSGAWSIKEVSPKGHLPSAASMQDGLGECFQ